MRFLTSVSIMGSIGPLRLLSRRLSSSSAKPPNHGGWTPIVADSFPSDFDKVDIGRWLFNINAPFLQNLPDKDVYNYLVKDVGEVLQDEEKAKNAIYHISSTDEMGFCAHVDKETKDKLSAMKYVRSVTPDYYYALRKNHPDTRRMTM